MALRPVLYDRLRRRLGHVIVAHPGEGMIERVGPGQNGRPRLFVKTYGEAYRICCPFCNDWQPRLWVNHRWGFWDDRVRSRNLWLACCFNEGCLKTYTNQKKLYDMVFEDARWRKDGPHIEDTLAHGELLDPDLLPDQVTPPGRIYPLHELYDDHPARMYVRQRGFDPDVLGRELSVSYCPEAFGKFHRVSNRLVIPVIMDGKARGWQARLIDGTPDRSNPKYLTMTGMKKKQCLYNFDEARRHPFVVVTEGPTKVWRFGQEAVAILGNRASEWQTSKLALWDTVVILLDGNAQDEAQELYDDLIAVKNRVLIKLQPDQEPGDFQTNELRRLVTLEAARQGVSINCD